MQPACNPFSSHGATSKQEIEASTVHVEEFNSYDIKQDDSVTIPSAKHSQVRPANLFDTKQFAQTQQNGRVRQTVFPLHTNTLKTRKPIIMQRPQLVTGFRNSFNHARTSTQGQSPARNYYS
jgi:hypothetical protein